MKSQNPLRLLRPILATLIPLVAFILQWTFWPAIRPYVWFLFYPAVFFSSWVGGLPGGLVATVISTALVWRVFIPSVHGLAVADPKMLISVAVFMGMGVLFSISHGRLRKANRQAAEALEAARNANDQLQAANEKITGLYEKTRELDDLKTQFFANVSHELRTALALILGPVGKRLAATDLTDEERQDLEVVDRNARLLYRHVTDLLDVAKIEAGRMVMHYAQGDLARLVRFMASHFEVLAGERQIRYAVQAPETLPAQLDAEKCQRILLNLLSNAFKFTPGGGALFTVALPLSAPEGIEIRATASALDEGIDRQALVEDYGEHLQGEARVYLDHITLASRHMGELIDGLLTLSRSTRGELRRDRVDLSALAERIRRELEQAEPERRVEWQIEPGLTARGDVRMIELVMSNLLGNAWKYTSKRPRARIEFGSLSIADCKLQICQTRRFNLQSQM